MINMVMGVLAGAAATVPMTVAMAALRWVFPQEGRRPSPPRQVTVRMARRAGADEVVDGEPEQSAATLVAHFGYGAATGALYGPLARRLPGPALLKGAAYGLAVWAASYQGWLPAAGIMPPATRQPPERNVTLILSHLVFGTALGAAMARLQH